MEAQMFLCLLWLIGRTIALQGNLQEGAVNLSPSVADVELTFQECCTLGLALAQAKDPCDNVLPTIHSVPLTLRSVCLSVQLQCCTQKRRIDSCEKGKVVAKQGIKCPDQSNNEEQFCCEACKVGLIVGAMGSACTLPPLRVGTLWNGAFQDCCNQIATPNKPTQSLIPATKGSGALTKVSGEKNVCTMWPGELCEHICVPVDGSYRCLCRPGYELMADNRTCQLAEPMSCQESNPCSHICQDSADGIVCSCPDGYELEDDELNCRLEGDVTTAANRCPAGYVVDSTTEACIDYDECQHGTDNCIDGIEICLNTIGSFTCEKKAQPSCAAGLFFNAATQKCLDVDECLMKTDSCDKELEVCVNTHGSYTCEPLKKVPKCDLGFEFKKDVNRCADVNECQLGLDNCDKELEKCINTFGGFICETIAPECDPGFEFNKGLDKCVDINECLSDKFYDCDSYQRCINTIGSYKCECRPGFQQDNITLACVDVNECQIDAHECLSTQRCDNTIGSYTCTRFLNCGTGYTLNGATGTCEDNDECKLGTDTCKLMGPDWKCHNTHGSYRCILNNTSPSRGSSGSRPPPSGVNSCSRGYQFYNNKCIDIDECLRATAPCPADFECVNTEGSFRCVRTAKAIRCPSGQRLNSIQTACVDINECKEIPNLCSHECINYVGKYRCVCPRGFRLLEDNRTCGDVNECEESPYKPCMGYCINELGSYSCQCPEGYRLARNNASCIDIDECTEDQPCAQDQICVNIGGSYRCADVYCQPGYVRHDHDCTFESRRCLYNDRDCLERPIAYRHHFLSIPSNQTFNRNQQLYTFRTTSQSPGRFEYKLDVHAEAPPDVPLATERDFRLIQEAYNVAKIYLTGVLLGPQDIRLQLTTTLRNHDLSTTRISYIHIYVSQFSY